MLQKLEGLKSTLWTGLLVSILFALVTYSTPYWTAKINFVENSVWLLFLASFFISAQFNRSRYNLLILVVLLYYCVKQGVVEGNSYLQANRDWLYLSGLLLLALLTKVKDRSLFSVHLVWRLIAIAGCIAAGYGWLLAIDYLQESFVSQSIVKELLVHLPINIPLFVIAFYVLYRSLRNADLLVSSLLTSLILLTMLYQQQISLPLSMLAVMLLSHYIVVVIVDSYYLAYRDELTGIPSRRALNQYALSLGRKYTVAMLDVDHFKKFNDNYGHDIGDQVLKLVGAKMAKVRGGGKVFRYGGEEFTVIFPRKNVEQCLHELESLRQTIADYKIVIRHPLRKDKKSRQAKKPDKSKSVSVTISIGVAAKESKQSFEEVIKVADQALYRAKKKGRNNVSQ